MQNWLKQLLTNKQPLKRVGGLTFKMDNKMITKIKKTLGIKTNRELAILLCIHESQITRWSKDGFHKSTEALLNLLLGLLEKD